MVYLDEENKMKKTYLDVKQEDKIIVEPSNLEIKVLALFQGGEVSLWSRFLSVFGRRSILFQSKPHKYSKINSEVGIYNFGSRHHGNRTHLRIDTSKYCDCKHIKYKKEQYIVRIEE